MKIIYAHEPFDIIGKSIFLAGPTPRISSVPGWRPDAIKIFNDIKFNGTLLIPEPRTGAWAENYDSQIEWEERGLTKADCVLFWIPRDMKGKVLFDYEMPGLTTNDEWGVWKKSGKVVLGVPPEAQHVSYQKYYAKKYGIPLSDSLFNTIHNAIEMVNK